jgi:hypothetical protein
MPAEQDHRARNGATAAADDARGQRRDLSPPGRPPVRKRRPVAGEMVNPALAGWSAATKKLFRGTAGPDWMAADTARVREVIT